MCLEERIFVCMGATRSDKAMLGYTRTKVTNVKFVQLGPDVLIFHPTLEQLVLDRPHQARTRKVELDDEIGSIHLDGLAVRFVMDVLIPATECGGIARCGEGV